MDERDIKAGDLLYTSYYDQLLLVTSDGTFLILSTEKGNVVCIDEDIEANLREDTIDVRHLILEDWKDDLELIGTIQDLHNLIRKEK